MSDYDKEEFMKDIDEIYKKYNVCYKTIMLELNAKYLKERGQKIKEICKSHKDMVGKCFIERIKPDLFPEMWRFYKVVSFQSSNEYRVECLVFDEHPTYWYDYQTNKGAGDWYLGNFDFESFHIEDVHINDLKELREISIVQYNQAMMNYARELVSLQWFAEHYRYGNKWPTDPEWKKDEK